MPGEDLRRAKVERLLVMLPTWLGDTVMATPTLAALRRHYPGARITALVRSNIRPILRGCPDVDRFISMRPRRKGQRDPLRGKGVNLARLIARGRFDMAVIMPNSFRTALVARMAGIPRRVGYDRDGRGGLLTDRLVPRRDVTGRFVPISAVDYYLGLARYLGVVDPDHALRLTTTPEGDARALALLKQLGADDPTQPASRPLVIFNPGANFGQAKLWPAQRFAKLADMFAQKLGACVAVSGSPNEQPILKQVVSHARSAVLNLADAGIDLVTLKSLVKFASLLVTNDTGTRHIAAALGTPVVTVFGPTDPAWSEVHHPHERQVYVDVYCRPCQKKLCPLANTPEFHQCMTKIEPEMVFDQARAVIRPTPVIAS